MDPDEHLWKRMGVSKLLTLFHPFWGRREGVYLCTIWVLSCTHAGQIKLVTKTLLKIPPNIFNSFDNTA
jgi:hypothetical protein